MVSNKNKQRIRIGTFAVLLDRAQLLFVRTATEQRLHAAHEKHLEGSHQGRRARPVKNFAEIGFREVEIEHAEVAHIVRHQMLEDGFAEALAEEDFVAHKDVGGPQLFLFDFGDEALSLRESPHQKPSSTLLTRVCAKSRERRPIAGESSSKKLLGSCDTWYCSRNTYAGF